MGGRHRTCLRCRCCCRRRRLEHSCAWQSTASGSSPRLAAVQQVAAMACWSAGHLLPPHPAAPPAVSAAVVLPADRDAPRCQPAHKEEAGEWHCVFGLAHRAGRRMLAGRTSDLRTHDLPGADACAASISAVRCSELQLGAAVLRCSSVHSGGCAVVVCCWRVPPQAKATSFRAHILGRCGGWKRFRLPLNDRRTRVMCSGR